MSTKRRKASRWMKGATRYDKKTEDLIQTKYREGDGWRHGAKVHVRHKS